MCKHRALLAAGLGSALILSGGAAQGQLDLSLRTDADASFGGDVSGEGFGGLSFDLDNDMSAFKQLDAGEVAGGLDGVVSGDDGYDEPGFGGGDGALPGTTDGSYAAPTPTAALLGAAGLAGLGVSRRRR